MSIMFADPAPVRADFWADGPDALPGRSRRPDPVVEPLRVRTTPWGDEFSEIWMRSEIYRMHAQPHLYEGWQRDRADEDWLTYLDRAHPGMVSTDCDTCRKAVIIPTHGAPCPTCAS